MPVVAYCQAQVDGVGVVDVEGDYLAHVVACENDAAGPAALAAQAIAARSYLYYRLDESGAIGDGQGDQVYSCANAPAPQHFAAVSATRGQVLRYQDTQVAAFYVAGARQDGPTCRGSSDDPTGTERFVTYNDGLVGDTVVQTTLGRVDPTNFANRGCMSQNGADCLGSAGLAAEDILRFYYGADIELVTASGDCGDGGGGLGDGGCGLAPARRRGGVPALLVVLALVPWIRRRRGAS